MLEKHKFLIENKIINNEINNYNPLRGDDDYYSFEVFNNELKVIIDNDTILSNNDDGIISVWNIKKEYDNTSIMINKINSLDVVAMIAIIDCTNKLVNVTIKQTPTNMYVSYSDESIGYDINKCRPDFIINIIEDYFNKKGSLSDNNKRNILNLIKVDIDEIFSILYHNKNNYINDLEHQLNSVKASYVMESESIKRKLKVINGYKK